MFRDGLGLSSALYHNHRPVDLSGKFWIAIALDLETGQLVDGNQLGFSRIGPTESYTACRGVNSKLFA